jgi:hypothetical protein
MRNFSFDKHLLQPEDLDYVDILPGNKIGSFLQPHLEDDDD